MKKIFKNLGSALLTIMIICTLCVQSQAIKYKDGRFISNAKIHEFIKGLVIKQEYYEEIEGEKEIRFDRIVFSFTFIKQNNTVKDIEIFVPVVSEDTVIIFFINMNSKKDLYIIEFINLFLNSNEFNEQNFQFSIDNSVSSQDWCGDTVNKYDDMFSVITDITEENWREKILNDEKVIIPDLCPDSLMFFEIHPGEKVFVAGYNEDDE